MLAYLVIREGAKWTDVFRLVPGQTVTIGRGPTNQVMIKDERCSRAHAEVFFADGRWVIRDLDSRNGTAVGAQLVRGDQPLSPGDIIRIGRSQLAFVHDLTNAFADGVAGPGAAPPAVETVQPADDVFAGDSSVLSEPPMITHRRFQTRLLGQPEAGQKEEPGSSSRIGRAAVQLARLAFEMAKTSDVEQLARQALDGLYAGTEFDAGAVLLLRRNFEGDPAKGELDVVASRTSEGQQYYRVPPFLASTVLRDGEAVLARNVMGDSMLARRDSKGEIHATSVICAPIRRGKQPIGLLHLYSTDAGRALDPDDLEFTLAVADTTGVVLESLSRQEELAAEVNKVQDENQQLRERLGVHSDMVGCSDVVRRITEEIARAASSRATVLIRGESGVGKELVARAVHYSSARRKNVFVCLNCAALTETLLESELFGHEKGAFTGATERKIGKFEAANGGTLMLDEIGEMSPTIQAKFLRVLEGHAFERVGGSQPVKVDVRVIAATNRDLERDVAAGVFRRDLYFRLRVLEIYVAPLRKRPEDIPLLCNYFLQKLNAETGRRLRGFSSRAMEQLVRYRWPGNVRELKNVIERAIVLARSEFIDQDDLMLSKLATAGDTQEGPVEGEYQPLTLDEVERRHILATLSATGWNKSQAAAILGIERSTLDRKIRRYELVEQPQRPLY